ncbi:MAG: VanZ family protein [bacterium]
MFQGPPHEKKELTWSFFIGWSLLIFAVIPFAPPLIRWVSQYLPLRMLVFGTMGVILAASVIAVVYLAWIAPRRRHANLLWMFGILLVYAYFCFFEVKADQEALHFLEYGFLGLLAFRALSHNVRDITIYVSAIAMVTVVASLDEVFQWATPGRYFDLHDVKFDAVSAFLAQVAIAKGMRPPFVSEPIKPRSVRVLCGLVVAQLLILAFCVWNTPTRVVRYAGAIPFLSFLQYDDNAMSEFGHRHTDRNVGVFYSRFTLDELAHLDGQRGEEVGRLIAANYKDSTNYAAFLQLRTAGTDPYLHEAAGHIAQRDHYSRTAWKYEKDPKRYRNHNTIAHGENLILEKYFPHVIEASGLRVFKKQVDVWKRNLNTEHAYSSRIDDQLIVRFRESELGSLLLAAILFVLFIRWRWGREREDVERGGAGVRGA